MDCRKAEATLLKGSTEPYTKTQLPVRSQNRRPTARTVPHKEGTCFAEDAGAAAVQLEDQILPKKCGHLSDKRLAEPEAMAAKIAAAVKARRHLRIIARTDAIASEGLEAAIKRAQMYRAAGADVI